MAENVQGGLALPTDNITESEAAARDPWRVPEWKVSGIFASHMVLQRDMPITVWGWCDHPGAAVCGTWDGETVTASVGADGRFALTFSPRAASYEPTEMTVSSDFGTTVFSDILVGDVWLVGGQSNAEMKLAPCLEETPEIAADLRAELPLRLFRQTQSGAAAHKEWHEFPARDIIDPDWTWRLPDEESAKSFSAIGYYVGRMLTEALDIPIGMVMMCAGGACLRELMPIELAHRLGYEKGANVPVAGYYNTLIAPLIGLAFKGQIFFQGESEGIWLEMAKSYAEDLAEYVADERARFGIDFPFYNFQLSSYGEQGAKFFRHLHYVRDSQHRALSIIPGYYLAITRDVGADPEAGDWAHSTHKFEPSCRVASQILAITYGIGDPADAFSPLPVETRREGDRILLRFDYVGDGLYTPEDAPVIGFSFDGEGDDQIPAAAEILSPDTVSVTVPEGADASRLHFCLSNIATLVRANLCGNDLPVGAFTVTVK
ncbi:MAG: hypothetical protein IKT60_00055 [Clostridia bacterium]|nr:hypothetical protein [Clostridia bacterium]